MSTPSTTGSGHAWTPRWLLVLAIMLGLALTYAVIWASFVRLHTVDIHHQQPPGASAEWDDTTFRVLSIEIQDVVPDAPTQSPDQEPGTPAPGAVWVTAALEVTGADESVLGGCQLELLGPGGRTWEPESSIYDDFERRCNDETGSAPTTIMLTYLVPEVYADQLYGLVVPAYSVHVKVIRP